MDEKPDIARLSAQMREATAALRKIAPAVTRIRFAMLDMHLAETPVEDWPARSWEVEREDFLRRLEGSGDHDGG